MYNGSIDDEDLIRILLSNKKLDITLRNKEGKKAFDCIRSARVKASFKYILFCKEDSKKDEPKLLSLNFKQFFEKNSLVTKSISYEKDISLEYIDLKLAKHRFSSPLKVAELLEIS